MVWKLFSREYFWDDWTKVISGGLLTYRNKKYYKGNESKVYSILDNEDVGDELGTWVKQDSGKFKLIKI